MHKGFPEVCVCMIHFYAHPTMSINVWGFAVTINGLFVPNAHFYSERTSTAILLVTVANAAEGL